MPRSAFFDLLAIAGFAATCLLSTPVAAQAQYGYRPLQPAPETPSAALARHVRMLAAYPRDFASLIGAGRAALALGDAQAAVGFYGRAEEVDPRSPLPKAGTAAALVAMEDPRAALGYFAEAQRFGATQASIAAHRGLAFDLIGDSVRAQSDYRVGLGGIDGDEARRRLALSLAIGGDRTAALAMLDPLTARRDPSAARIRALILALTGDVSGAVRVVNVAMPGAGPSMEQFFRRLAGLSREQKAAAVHFGHIPDANQPSYAAVEPPASPFAAPAAAVPLPPPPAVSTPVRAVDSGTVDLSQPPLADPVKLALATPTENVPSPPPAAIATVADPERSDRLSTIDQLLANEPIVRAPASDPAQEPAAETSPPVSKPKVEKPAKPAASAKAKPSVAKAVDQKSADKGKAADKKATDKGKAAEKAKEATKSPRRHWVQLAGGANTARMPVEYKRIKTKKPALFAKRTAHIAEIKGWTRLLIGPFKSEDEGQAFVNELAKASIDGFSWTSPSGQTIEKLALK